MEIARLACRGKGTRPSALSTPESRTSEVLGTTCLCCHSMDQRSCQNAQAVPTAARAPQPQGRPPEQPNHCCAHLTHRRLVEQSDRPVHRAPHVLGPSFHEPPEAESKRNQRRTVGPGRTSDISWSELQTAWPCPRIDCTDSAKLLPCLGLEDGGTKRTQVSLLREHLSKRVVLQ